MSSIEELRNQLANSPDLPGVYLFRDLEGTVLYVGKALSLRKRLSSYLPSAKGEWSRNPAKVNEMVGRASAVEWIATGNEVDAFILEHNLIKQHRPPFNIRLRDDKSYPYIVVTMEDEYPRIMLTRQAHRKGDLYFGPFANAAKVRETLDVLARIFPLRSCRGRTPGRRSGSPCLQFHIERCTGPCLGAVDVEDYRAVVNQVVDFLSGRESRVIAGLRTDMQAAAGRQDFESAALIRDRLDALTHILERQRVESSSLQSTDIIGFAADSAAANVQVFITRDGKLADRRSLTLINVEDATEEEIFEQFVAEYYSSSPSVPAELIVPVGVCDMEKVASYLEGLRGSKVEVRRAERGDKRRLQELADRNASLSLVHERLREERARERRYGALCALAETLRLERIPFRIEGFDISNLGEDNVVASMVVFEGGAPKKSDYRRFLIGSVSGPNDVGSMREVVGRRFGNAAERAPAEDDGPETVPRAYDPSFEAVPDLVVVDGGKGQLAAALAALSATDLTGSVAVVSLAKREEEIFVPWSPDSIRLRPDDPGLLLLRRVRDEAHRFALTFHRSKRGAQTRLSLLDQLPGIGEKRKRAILLHFGSPERFLEASREEIESVPGLPGKVAREVYAHVHKTG